MELTTMANSMLLIKLEAYMNFLKNYLILLFENLMPVGLKNDVTTVLTYFQQEDF